MSIWATHDIWQAKSTAAGFTEDNTDRHTAAGTRLDPDDEARHRMALCNRLGNHLDISAFSGKVLVLVRH